MVPQTSSGRLKVSQIIINDLTPKDYLTVRPDGVFLDGVPAKGYKGVRLFNDYCVWSNVMQTLLKSHPNIQELHCFIDYSYTATREMTWGFRAKMVEDSTTPWYSFHGNINMPFVVLTLVVNCLAFATVHEDIVKNLSYFDGDPKLISAKVAKVNDQIMRQQAELLRQSHK